LPVGSDHDGQERRDRQGNWEIKTRAGTARQNQYVEDFIGAIGHGGKGIKAKGAQGTGSAQLLMPGLAAGEWMAQEEVPYAGEESSLL
jgi:hypothetical protein